MARQEINWNEIDPDDFWLWEELDDLYDELDASGVEDATEWEHFGAIESILYTLAERAVWRENYPREQYEADRKRMIAEGVNPRCIMSYSECMAYDFYKAEEEAYDEWERDLEEAYAERELEFDAEQLMELVDEMEVSANVEREVFGSAEPWFFGSAEASVVYETGYELWEDDRIECFDDNWNVTDEWKAWDAASEDIPGFFELNLSM